MLNNKKRIFLYVSIILLILVGVYFITLVEGLGYVTRDIGVTNVSTSTNTYASVNDSKWGGAGNSIGFTELINWTRGGNDEVVIFNLNFTGSSGFNSTAEINISIPTGYNINFSSINLQFSNSTVLTNQAANWTINLTSSVASFQPGVGNLSLGSRFNASFAIYANNASEIVVNWTVTIRDNTSGGGTRDAGLGLLTGIDGLPPRSNTTNVTDSVNTRTSFSSTQYLKYDATSAQQGVNITLSLTDYNMDRVLLVYNSTGGSINFQVLRNLLYNQSFLNGNLTGLSIGGERRNFTILVNNGSNLAGAGGDAGFTTALGSRSRLNPTATEYVFMFNISNNTWGLGATDGTTFNYVFVVYDLYNNSEIINNSNSAYTIARDVDRPTATLTEPTDTSIGVFDPIKYKCDGADSSALASCTAKITKPSGGTVSKTGCGTEQTFTTTDTNEAGTYTIECSTKDNVGRTNSKSSTFTVSAAGGGISAGAGVGGGGGGSAEEAIIVPAAVTGDLGTLTTTDVYTSIDEDGSVSFIVAGSSHSVKVLDVDLTANAVTIEVSSHPQQLTLTVGETKEVDITDDGVNDLIITLSSITDGKADLVFKSTVEAAPPAEVPPEEVITGEEVKPSLTWLWVVIVIIVVILLIWYFSRRKR